MKESWEYIPQHFITSTVKKTGRRELLAYIDELNEQYRKEGIKIFEQ
jgi:GTP-binding protein